MNNEVPTQYSWISNINDNSVSFVDENEATNQTKCDDSNSGDFSIVEQTMENDYDIEYFDTVHPNISCSVNDAMTMIYAFSIRHGLNWEAIEDMAQLVNSITGTDRVPTTKYKFKQKFERKNCTKPTVHFLCHSCHMYLDTKENLQNSDQKICSNCQTEICTDTKYKKNHFLSIPIEHHLKNVLQRNSKFINLNFDSSSSLIRDVHDANGFKKLKSEMHGIKYITLTVNTDGGAVFKKTKNKSFWPIQFYVNEIDLEHRFDRQNILCSSISFGKMPNMQVFFKPFLDEINSMNGKGGISYTNENGSIVKVIVIPMLITADAPAKAHILNLIHPLGRFGCPYCLHGGTHIEGTTQYRYCQRGDERCRTNEQARANMLEAHQTGNSVNGYRGLSALMAFKFNFDIVWQVVLDKMHCVDLGVIKKIFDLCLSPKNRNERLTFN